MMLKSVCQTLAVAILLLIAALSVTHAQEFGAAFAGFGSSNKEPIQIQADALEVLDAEKRAIFSGNVDVIQGETQMKTAVLDVYYTGDANNTGGGQGISRLIATGKVWVQTGTNTATGDEAVYDALKEEVVLTGNVILSQCENVIKGSSLTVDLKTGKANLVKKKGRVQAIFTPGGGEKPSAPKEEGC